MSSWDQKHPEYYQEYRNTHKEWQKVLARKWHMANLLKHRLSGSAWRRVHPESVAFGNIVQRTTNPNHPCYRHYGARGIENRLTSYRDIIAAIGCRPNKHYSIDRIDNNGHYDKTNIRWATKTEQANNRRTN